MSPAEASLDLAERVLPFLRAHAVDAIVIGGVALAAHNYARSTDDVDLGVTATADVLAQIRDELERAGYQAIFRKADGADPLGGVIDIDGPDDGFVQVVNFDNLPGGGFPGVIRDALAALGPPTGALRVAPLPYLVAMKLYAGGMKSESDIRELVKANPDADWKAIRELCKGYRLPVKVLPGLNGALRR